jgi:hypothetical protein
MPTEDVTTLFDCYRFAIVRMATCLAIGEKTRPPLLVFASLEFVHADRPCPDSTPLDGDVPPHTHGDGSSSMRVYFRRVAMRASDALQWYLDASKGNLAVPIPIDPADRGRYDGTTLRCPSLTEEPPWPQLAFPISDQSLFNAGQIIYPTPFLGPGSAPARIHRLMAAADPDLESLPIDAAACNWLAPRIHFRIEDYRELMGGIVLVAPDPQVAKVTQYFSRDARKKERLVTQVQARAKQNLKELGLTIFEEWFGAISTFRQLPVPSEGYVVTDPPAEIRASGYMLGHSTRGLIDFQPPTPFMRSVGVTMETSTRRVKLQTRESRKRDAETTEHEVNEQMFVTNSLIGETTPPLDAHSRFWESVALRQTSGQARKSDQQWIDDPAVARAFLRGLIGGARKEVFVADRFFDGEDLSSYLHFVSRLSVSIKILTSREAFKTGADRKARVQAMLMSLATFRTRGLTEVQVRVMRNKDGEPILHDRFLVVDGAVWFSGNSLNAIGRRESVIVKLPDPRPILARLDALFDNDSEDFLTFANTQNAAQ